MDEVGDSNLNTIDYAGDDIEALAQEVCADDPEHPLVFVRGKEEEEIVIGRFFTPEYQEKDSPNKSPVALMIERTDF